MGKYFRCQCPRCLDPTELGTHFSSLACTSCHSTTAKSAAGLLTFDTAAGMWQCNVCSLLCSDRTVQQRLAEARQLALAVDGFDVSGLERLIGRQSLLLNTNHYLVVESKQKLVAILRSMCERDVRTMRRADGQRLLELKGQLCAELLPVLRVLKPGISRLTGE